mmetsp:Transcript_31275/g.46148  ORF Transcript_31275/g.46148 Transcript_31275/m.46148 type:complete len:328 (-) Transcript_31275:2263-3246(-)|eukprot:CAMPEP_0194205478 /NCGR_PEP_ID=MMETSP0156-20130528/4736_1 /TAXON_ID=33649 /ORGANISM="Thalassionema nitzschioides, Strain L26-B" /LENGTH=327 /DNA_ID=CAMNT_0038931755 /DNA_START=97 /DNA_END=1080 /DNA_ORIENTATION=+
MSLVLVILSLFLALIFATLILYIFYPAISIAAGPCDEPTLQTISQPANRTEEDDILLSIVIPAYNEEIRLPIMLDAAIASLEKHRARVIELAQAKSSITSTSTFEWIVVSDGSTDGTEEVVRQYVVDKNTSGDVWKLVSLKSNAGKGAAVKTGMLAARGAIRLMVDADGATDFNALVTLLSRKKDIVFGSRAHLASKAQRSFIRTLLMHCFHFFVNFLVGTTIGDTQCGFKLFSQGAAQKIFGNLHLRRWAFDIEIVVLATQLNMRIDEVGVPWEEVEGSKLDSSKLQLALISIGMLRDMLCVRLCYTLGIWAVKDLLDDIDMNKID